MSGSSNGTRKYGRNKVKCARYSSEGRYQTNKRRKLDRHIKKNPNDVIAIKVRSNV